MFGSAYWGGRYWGARYFAGTGATPPPPSGNFYWAPSFFGARFFGPAYFPGLGPGPAPPGGDLPLYGGASFLAPNTSDPFGSGDTEMLA